MVFLGKRNYNVHWVIVVIEMGVFQRSLLDQCWSFYSQVFAIFIHANEYVFIQRICKSSISGNPSKLQIHRTESQRQSQWNTKLDSPLEKWLIASEETPKQVEENC